MGRGRAENEGVGRYGEGAGGMRRIRAARARGGERRGGAGGRVDGALRSAARSGGA